jgi:hypothetical protein
MFRDYFSAFDEARKTWKDLKEWERQLLKTKGLDKVVKDYKLLYQQEITVSAKANERLATARLSGELIWYTLKRPYFNVYPAVETKLDKVSENIELKDVSLPFPVLEIRTFSSTMLLCDTKTHFVFTIDNPNNNTYEEMMVLKNGTLGQLQEFSDYEIEDSVFTVKSETHRKRDLQKIFNKHLRLACGVCLLSKDPAIIRPVILNQHYREDLTPEQIEDYAKRATSRTGRIGFEVGKELERTKNSAHYRNGCFAIYHVSKNHEKYPPHAVSDRAPVIIWRSGTVVNRDYVPPIPTGYKDK